MNVGPGQYDPSVIITKKQAPQNAWSTFKSKRTD